MLVLKKNIYNWHPFIVDTSMKLKTHLSIETGQMIRKVNALAKIQLPVPEGMKPRAGMGLLYIAHFTLCFILITQYYMKCSFSYSISRSLFKSVGQNVSNFYWERDAMLQEVYCCYNSKHQPLHQEERK